MKRFLSALTAIFVAGSITFAANIPLVPSNPTYSEPSQIIATLNTLINQLNGNAGFGPAATISLGTYGTASGATPVTLNTQKGVVSFTGVATLVTGAVTTLTMTNSSITANSACTTQVQSGGAAGSAPYVSTFTPTAGSAAMILANGGLTATGATQTFVIAYNCFN